MRRPLASAACPAQHARAALAAGLLVGVHEKATSASGLAEKMIKADRAPGLAVLESQTELQYVCIVDVLTVYTARKARRGAEGGAGRSAGTTHMMICRRAAEGGDLLQGHPVLLPEHLVPGAAASHAEHLPP